jgi:Kef-type K+ transport system membrane component KefB
MFNSALLLIQIAVIVGVSRLVASAFGRLRQPQVVGEMVAGIALGPTLFGLVAPTAYQSLFPPSSLPFLGAVSQVGLIIFIFLIGVRVDFAELRRQSGIAVVTSNVSVIVPFLMGIGLAQYLFPRYGTGDRLTFALFVGTAVSVTAFPVLARILMERNLMGTRLGSVAIACAAVDDLTAWILLAIIVALTERGQHTRPVWLMFVYLAVYTGFMALLGRVLNAWSKRIDETKLPLEAILVFIILALVSGAAGEWIGVHSFIGAFAAGLVTPRRFRARLIGTLETITILILIPLFFALTGIRTNLIFKSGTSAWLDLLVIIVVAVASKWGGTMIGALAKGMPWRDACQLGLLMNTRGLVALIVLSVGLDAGILSPALFSMMVFMALVTTFMATPLMDRVGAGIPEMAFEAAGTHHA